jgi:hypothetical protein
MRRGAIKKEREMRKRLREEQLRQEEEEKNDENDDNGDNEEAGLENCGLRHLSPLGESVIMLRCSCPAVSIQVFHIASTALYFFQGSTDTPSR